MRKLYLLIVFLTFFIGCETYNGETHLEKKTFTHLVINGHGKLKEVKATYAKFSSAVEAYESKFNEIESAATLECHECVIEKISASNLKAFDKSTIKKAIIKNNVILEDSSIDDLTFAGTEGVFKNSRIKSISNTGFTNKRVVVLIDSQVEEDVTFESTEECKVILKGGSKVLGKVINGIIE